MTADLTASLPELIEYAYRATKPQSAHFENTPKMREQHERLFIQAVGKIVEAYEAARLPNITAAEAREFEIAYEESLARIQGKPPITSEYNVVTAQTQRMPDGALIDVLSNRKSDNQNAAPIKRFGLLKKVYRGTQSLIQKFRERSASASAAFCSEELAGTRMRIGFFCGSAGAALLAYQILPSLDAVTDYLTKAGQEEIAEEAPRQTPERQYPSISLGDVERGAQRYKGCIDDDDGVNCSFE